MNLVSNYDVIVIGAGAAGLTAAIGLARAGLAVALLEAAAYPGAENWSGCVYFCENLVHPEVLGPGGMERLAWERRLVERGFFMTDGQGLLGMTYRDPAAFPHCFTVLRPIFDQHLAQVAVGHGVALLNETTVESLIREQNRVIGVCTNRGPMYADLVFLAEGDASHLVTREGYERYTDPREAPKFLQGIKQVIDMPPGAVEEIFGVGADEGVAYEMLLRNGRLGGQPLTLNMGGFLYTNRQSISLGLVLPVDNLHHHFAGDPNLLMEWFEDLPALRPWLREGKRGVYGAKLIRGGGAKDIPNLIDDGLAIGGAASAIGIDFPFPNFTGPATAMGLLLVQAARRIRDEGGDFTSDNLRHYYYEPLRRTHYWNDVEFLRRWPPYVKKTAVFFDQNIDLALGSGHIWTQPGRWWMGRWAAWVRLLLRAVGPGQWMRARSDLRHLARALRLREVFSRPSVGRLLLDGTVNALRDLFRRPRANLAPAGTIRILYRSGDAAKGRSAPGSVRRWFRRFAPVLASAARKVYSNEPVPLAEKLPGAAGLLLRQINLLDLLLMGAVGLSIGVTSAAMLGWGRIRRWLGRADGASRGQLDDQYLELSRQTTDLTPLSAVARQHWEARLARLSYHTARKSHIHLLWPRAIQDKNKVVDEGLWNVCPAHVYEARLSPLGQLQLVVNFENCIKCETCWRASPLVDWGRDGRQRFTYPVVSPMRMRLWQAVQSAGVSRPALPRALDPWAEVLQRVEASDGPNGQDLAWVADAQTVLARLEAKLQAFDDALGEEPRIIDRARAEYLEMLARYVQQFAMNVMESVRRQPVAPQVLSLAAVLLTRTEERARRTWDGRFAWAAADGRQIRQHHLVGLRRLLDAITLHGSVPSTTADISRAWLQVEINTEAVRDTIGPRSRQLEEVLGPSVWRALEHGNPLTAEQDAALRDLVAQVPLPQTDCLSETLHPPVRKALLADLGRRDPSLAYRVACHLWARDLAHLASGSSALEEAAQRWRRADEWTSFCTMDAVETPGGANGLPRWHGSVLFVPAIGVRQVLMLWHDRLVALPTDLPGVSVTPLATLGLRGAGLARIHLDGVALPETQVGVDYERIHRVWTILSAADLISIASGMADQLCRRALVHAAGRVQFPGLFHDEEARDTIGKFGAVKRMVAEMAARRAVIETLDHNLTPGDFSTASLERVAASKALVAEALGTAPGSLSYNAGQIFGGTGYSEDDLLAKYYRDAAAWRFLGPANAGIGAGRGQTLLHSWRSHQPLATLADETALFEQVAQRKALQAELDEIRNARSRLRSVVTEWLAATLAQTPATEAAVETGPGWPMGGNGQVHRAPGGIAGAEIAEALARQEAMLIGSKALLLRTHARLENGLDAETDIALLRVWLEGASNALDEFENTVRRHIDNSRRREDRPVVEPAVTPLVKTYAEYLTAPSPYQSGDFLVMPLDLARPRLVPEMLETDPVLAASDQHFRELLIQQFGAPRGNGLPYERYIERQHRPDAADLEFCRQHGFFRIPIPRELGGEGRPKIDYYLLITNAQRLADVAIALTIQANTSIGTTPILLARDKDLARAKKTRGPEQQDELNRRMETCDLFLRWVASGQISAFALTEPSAGSDTARVATRARLRSVPVAADADGVLSFIPAGGKDTRYLLDAHRLVFHANSSDPSGAIHAAYRWSDKAEPAPIHFEEYDYETDDPRKQRYYEHGNRRVHFTDIAQLRQRDGQAWYDYWELTGAKMWITNGRMAGVMCLYAKTDEGVTGFIVDRHAEGLIVGKDEEKLGQCGSPTNELSLQAVRVPRENVLGLEGRGQVNALETLNVGRAGLAMTSVAQMAGLISASRTYARDVHGDIPDWAGWRIARMEELAFVAESLAFDVIGRFEHPGTQSVRMESAISKMVATELLHRIIELAEEVHGLAGQTQLHLVEKRKRDARVLNIYEGTNEIQRFLILKDLASDIASRWAKQPATAPAHLGREALQLEALKATFRQRLDAALANFGQDLWQNPNLQANCFLLPEAAAWLKAAEATLGRLAWLSRLTPAEEDAESSPRMNLARRALARAQSEVGERLTRFDEELTHLRRGFYAPSVRAANLLFERLSAPEKAELPVSTASVPLRVLVIIEPTAALVPQPEVVDGRLMETHYRFSDADQAALEAGLLLRDQANATVTVAAVGPKALGQVLRQALNLGIDRVRLVVPATEPLSPDSAAAGLAGALSGEPPFHLILTGQAGVQDEEGLVGLLTAANLRVLHAGTAAALAVQASAAENTLLLLGADGRSRTRPFPAAVTVEPGVLNPRAYTTAGYLAGVPKTVQVHRWPRQIIARPVTLTAAAQAPMALAPDTHGSLTASEAAKRLRNELGLAGSSAAAAPYDGLIEDVDHPSLLEGSVPSEPPHRPVIVVIAADGGVLLPSAEPVLRTGQVLAAALDAAVIVLVLGPTEEEKQRHLLGQLRQRHAGDIVVWPIGDTAVGLRGKLLAENWPPLANPPVAVVGEPWVADAFATLASRPGASEPALLRIRRIAKTSAGLAFDTSRAQGKIQARQLLPLRQGQTCWIALASAVEMPPADSFPHLDGSRVQRWTPRLESFFGRTDIQRMLDELKVETGLVRLADADFIIDVGFGVANRDGYEAVIEPLERALRRLGVRNLVIGGSRKVTEELHLLPTERQIGQSGVSVNPQVLLAIGISGAPQHLNYIGPRATVVAFNRDPEAPIMTLNQRQPRPRVLPVVGDLFETVPALTATLAQENSAQPELAEQAGQETAAS